MRNMFGMFSFAFCVFSTHKCEAVNFLEFWSACVNARPHRYFGVLFLIIACAPCTFSDAHANHDVTRFAYDANHVTMTSPAFAFHLWHGGMRLHDVIGVHLSWFVHGDDVGMTSLCSHCIDDVITFTS